MNSRSRKPYAFRYSADARSGIIKELIQAEDRHGSSKFFIQQACNLRIIY